MLLPILHNNEYILIGAIGLSLDKALSITENQKI